MMERPVILGRGSRTSQDVAPKRLRSRKRQEFLIERMPMVGFRVKMQKSGYNARFSADLPID
jgi:hypothetical protein